MSTLPVRSPLPRTVPSIRSAPARTPSSAAATAHPERCGERQYQSVVMSQSSSQVPLTSVVMGMQTDNTLFSLGDVGTEVLDLISETVGRSDLDSSRQVL
jgi:hypothetical protein